MKNKLILTLCLCASVVISSAQNEITLEDIWTKGTFSAKGVAGFNSMNDGKYYSAQDQEGNIIRYGFADGKPVDTILSKSDATIARYSYRFNRYAHSLGKKCRRAGCENCIDCDRTDDAAKHPERI